MYIHIYGHLYYSLQREPLHYFELGPVVRAAQTKTAIRGHYRATDHGQCTRQADNVYNTSQPSVLGSIASHRTNKINMEAALV